MQVMPAKSELSSSLESELLRQLGQRLREARRRLGLSAVALAHRVGVSRTTLQAVEAGEPSPTLGTYARVLSELGMAGDLAFVGTGIGSPPPVSLGPSSHAHQDLQSLQLHEKAVLLLRSHPELAGKAAATLHRWRSTVDPRTAPLLDEWDRILATQDWAAALARTEKGNQLRQASPLTTLLPPNTRAAVLARARAHRNPPAT
jgi:transcriptional regulator with XRE-family HTH domain